MTGAIVVSFFELSKESVLTGAEGVALLKVGVDPFLFFARGSAAWCSPRGKGVGLGVKSGEGACFITYSTCFYCLLWSVTSVLMAVLSTIGAVKGTGFYVSWTVSLLLKGFPTAIFDFMGLSPAIVMLRWNVLAAGWGSIEFNYHIRVTYLNLLQRQLPQIFNPQCFMIVSNLKAGHLSLRGVRRNDLLSSLRKW